MSLSGTFIRIFMLLQLTYRTSKSDTYHIFPEKRSKTPKNYTLYLLYFIILQALNHLLPIILIYIDNRRSPRNNFRRLLTTYWLI